MAEEVKGEEKGRRIINRRRLLALATAAAAGLAITPLTERTHAATGDALIIGKENSADPEHETLLNTNIEEPSFGMGPKAGLRVTNASETGRAIFASSCWKGWGVTGLSFYGVGVEGVTLYGTAVRAQVKPEGLQTATALKVEGKSILQADIDGGVGLLVQNKGGVDPSGNRPTAIQGHSSSGRGVHGTSDAHAGVVGRSDAEFHPSPPDKPSLHGGFFGVMGVSKYGFGVQGRPTIPLSADFITWYTSPDRGVGGVLGYSDTGKAVVGFSDTGIGVEAIGKEGTALRVKGKSSFSTVGSGFIDPAVNSLSVDVPNSLVTESSHITVTLTEDPIGRIEGENKDDKSKVAVSWIKRTAGVGFTIYLTDKVKQKTPFTYFIVEP